MRWSFIRRKIYCIVEDQDQVARMHNLYTFIVCLILTKLITTDNILKYFMPDESSMIYHEGPVDLTWEFCGFSYAQDELLWSLFVCCPSIHPSVRPSVNIFKRLLLWSRWANFAQISYGASLGWGNERLLKWSRSVDQDGPHAHIW